MKKQSIRFTSPHPLQKRLRLYAIVNSNRSFQDIRVAEIHRALHTIHNCISQCSDMKVAQRERQSDLLRGKK